MLIKKKIQSPYNETKINVASDIREWVYKRKKKRIKLVEKIQYFGDGWGQQLVECVK